MVSENYWLWYDPKGTWYAKLFDFQLTQEFAKGFIDARWTFAEIFESALKLLDLNIVKLE